MFSLKIFSDLAETLANSYLIFIPMYSLCDPSYKRCGKDWIVTALPCHVGQKFYMKKYHLEKSF